VKEEDHLKEICEALESSFFNVFDNLSFLFKSGNDEKNPIELSTHMPKDM
jgi:hypothetical protein